jgi:K+-transporting ATPase ATPase C chain
MQSASPKGESTLSHLFTSLLYTLVTVVVLGLIYPLVIWGLGSLLFPHQANGSLVESDGKLVGSEIVGQLWTKPQYFHGRPSAAGKGYDPTSTKATIAALKKANPNAPGEPPIDLVTSSGSGIDPDISPEAAAWQVPRVAQARKMTAAAVQAIVDANVTPRQFGILGEPHVNVLALNRALDAAK